MPYAIMILAGIAVPMLAALNATLGRSIGSPAIAATILFVVALATALPVAALTGGSAWARAATGAPHLYLGGALIAFYVLSITWIAPVIGVGNAVFCVLLGQLVAAALIDHFGLFGNRLTPVSLTRAGGLALMAAGVFLAQKA